MAQKQWHKTYVKKTSTYVNCKKKVETSGLSALIYTHLLKKRLICVVLSWKAHFTPISDDNILPNTASVVLCDCVFQPVAFLCLAKL